MEIVKRNIILTFDELRILLYSQGYRRCEGIYMPEKEFTQEEIIRALGKLVGSGLLTVNRTEPAAAALPLVFTDNDTDTSGGGVLPAEEEFYIRDDLLEMIGIIGDPAATEILQQGTGIRMYCYYSDKGIVTSERFPGRKECVRLTLYNAEEFERFRRGIEEEIL